MTTTTDRPAPRRHHPLRRVAVVMGWLVIAALPASVTYALLVFGGR